MTLDSIRKRRSIRCFTSGFQSPIFSRTLIDPLITNSIQNTIKRYVFWIAIRLFSIQENCTFQYSANNFLWQRLLWEVLAIPTVRYNYCNKVGPFSLIQYSYDMKTNWNALSKLHENSITRLSRLNGEGVRIIVNPEVLTVAPSSELKHIWQSKWGIKGRLIKI